MTEDQKAEVLARSLAQKKLTQNKLYQAKYGLAKDVDFAAILEQNKDNDIYGEAAKKKNPFAVPIKKSTKEELIAQLLSNGNKPITQMDEFIAIPEHGTAQKTGKYYLDENNKLVREDAGFNITPVPVGQSSGLFNGALSALTGGVSDILQGNSWLSGTKNAVLEVAGPQLGGAINQWLVPGGSTFSNLDSAIKSGDWWKAVDAIIDSPQFGSVDYITRHDVAPMIPESVKPYATSLGSLIGSIWGPIGASAGYGIGSKIAGQDYGSGILGSASVLGAGYAGQYAGSAIGSLTGSKLAGSAAGKLASTGVKALGGLAKTAILGRPGGAQGVASMLSGVGSGTSVAGGGISAGGSVDPLSSSIAATSNQATSSSSLPASNTQYRSLGGTNRSVFSDENSVAGNGLFNTGLQPSPEWTASNVAKTKDEQIDYIKAIRELVTS
jgi:hypothetical protein